MGLASQMIAWHDEFCASLAARGYRVIRFDNRDIGLSTSFDSAGVPNIGAAMAAALQGKPVDAPYRPERHGRRRVRPARRARHRARPRRRRIDGRRNRADHGDRAPRGRLRTLTSIMATTGAPGLPPPTPEAMAVLLKPPATTLEDYVASYAQTWKVLRAGSFPEDEALDRERAERLHARGLNPPGVARQLAAILASGSRKAALGAVRVPTLVIHGDADPLVPLACGVDTAESIPGARLVVVEGMGHALPISHWRRIIDAIAAHAA